MRPIALAFVYQEAQESGATRWRGHGINRTTICTFAVIPVANLCKYSACCSAGRPFRSKCMLTARVASTSPAKKGVRYLLGIMLNPIKAPGTLRNARLFETSQKHFHLVCDTLSWTWKPKLQRDHARVLDWDNLGILCSSPGEALAKSKGNCSISLSRTTSKLPCSRSSLHSWLKADPAVSANAVLDCKMFRHSVRMSIWPDRTTSVSHDWTSMHLSHVSRLWVSRPLDPQQNRLP